MAKARKIIKEYKPDLVVGVGGYASGPVLWSAVRMGIPSLIQEQNSCAGITNRFLGKRAKTICVAYEGMDKYFPRDRIVLTGNPVRQEVLDLKNKYADALKYFNIKGNRKVLLIMGGSLGAKTINESVLKNIDLLQKSGIDVIWQTGRLYFESVRKKLEGQKIRSLKTVEFIARMDYAYSVADIIIARAGAITISELCAAGKPSILVPSPNVAEDHQTKNALALVHSNAALMIKDPEAEKRLIPEALMLINNKKLTDTLSTNSYKLGIKNSAERIVDEIYKLLN